jgi:hypothetical protein
MEKTMNRDTTPTEAMADNLQSLRALFRKSLADAMRAYEEIKFSEVTRTIEFALTLDTTMAAAIALHGAILLFNRLKR